MTDSRVDLSDEIPEAAATREQLSAFIVELRDMVFQLIAENDRLTKEIQDNNSVGLGVSVVRSDGVLSVASTAEEIRISRKLYQANCYVESLHGRIAKLEAALAEALRG